ncbi:hypothetical protein Tco_0727102 [Tanacetum coccineum]|uniref:Uncharacterized protein n=1 Tax=Tanacetum coccineum TaxID=301880 RepID=A0ABQ4YJR4_9ASTR
MFDWLAHRSTNWVSTTARKFDYEIGFEQPELNVFRAIVIIRKHVSLCNLVSVHNFRRSKMEVDRNRGSLICNTTSGGGNLVQIFLRIGCSTDRVPKIDEKQVQVRQSRIKAIVSKVSTTPSTTAFHLMLQSLKDMVRAYESR